MTFTTGKPILRAIFSATVLIVTVTAGGGGVASAHGGRTTQVLFHDDFSAGFDDVTAWHVISTGTATGAALPKGDGIITSSARGITVVPTGTNPRTGQPAFVSTAAPDSGGFGGGTSDHLKWAAQPRQSAANGVEVPATGALVCTTKMAAQALGIVPNPFGAAVSDPQSDPRLASATMITVDHEKHAVANFTLTNTEIYAVYERLPVDGSTYAAYHFSIPVAHRTPADLNTLQVKFDRGGERITWLVDGRRVLSTDRIGTLAFPRKYLRYDHGGTPERVAEHHVQCAIGTGNLLDGAGGVEDRDKRALVRLSNAPNFYYSAKLGPPHPQAFVDDASLLSNRLWGEGVRLRVGLFDMSYTS
ncbi:hypothetical protein Drose_14650 [Dactylosporangium roseum]|uniref:Uncharacterized protein n=1 Tax=Dactylosporangium roseum TaxID=47989 RepID=A0ABY5ZCR3_9ACTN|nr:DUF6081 family protein [Dactylosporangium roseum]UWZ39361.1 hypothetical protein Drose_14650 [Dactylosporangium roseum]